MYDISTYKFLKIEKYKVCSLLCRKHILFKIYFEFYLTANINLFHILLSNSFLCVLLVIFTMCIVHVCLVFSSMLTRWSRSTDEIRQKTWENVLINALIPRNENKHCCRIEMINGILKVNIPERSHCFTLLFFYDSWYSRRHKLIALQTFKL